MSFIISDTSTIFLQLVLATFLGMLLGVERSLAGKTAGMRTYALVSLGAALFIITSVNVAESYAPFVAVDQLRVLSGIISSVGFLGAGIIIFRNSKLSGLTTAASLWLAAGIGVTSGYKMYALAIFTTFLTLTVFTLLWFIEEKVKKMSYALSGNPDYCEPCKNPESDKEHTHEKI